MSCAIELLDEALELAKKEKSALEDGSYDKAMTLAEQRGELTGMAWNKFEPAISAAYRKRLEEIMALQKQMTEIATRARDAVREKLSQSRREKRRIQGYHLAVGQALQ